MAGLRFLQSGPIRIFAWLLLGAGALAAAYVAGAQALAYSVARSDAARAHALTPWDGRLGGRLAMRLSAPKADKEQRGRADRIAIAALQRDATAVDAVVALGTNSAVGGDIGSARRYFDYAEILSRREIAVQLWAIEDAVRRNDIRSALVHYDIALRRSVAAREILFPILGSALVEPEVRAALVQVFSARPSWGAAFIFDVAGKGSEPRATAALFQALKRAKLPVSEAAQAMLVDTLVGRGDVDAAWSFYASMRPGADRRRSRDPRFVAELASRAPFDWQLFGQSGIFTAIERSGDGGIISFSVPPSGSGLLVRQMQFLPAGRYALSGHSRSIEQPEIARPYWQLSCQDGRELGRVVLPGSGRGVASFSGTFIVPLECRVQYLSLIAKVSETSASIEGEVHDAQLAPAG
jgi:hypothetical protein